MKFSEILKELMEEKGFNQSSLAEASGLRQGQISEWLSDKAVPGFFNLRILAEVLNVSGDEILGLSNDFTKKNK